MNSILNTCLYCIVYFRMEDGMVDFGCLCSIILQLMEYSKRYTFEDCNNFVITLKSKDIVLVFTFPLSALK